MNGIPNEKLAIIGILCFGIIFVLSFGVISGRLAFAHSGRLQQFGQIITATLRTRDAENALPQHDTREIPIQKAETTMPVLSANAFMSIFVAESGAEKVLIEKNTDQQLPIASITKLMVALVASREYKSNEIVSISKHALSGDGLSGMYHAGNRFLFVDALYALLLASHNEIAGALAEQKDMNDFIYAMNAQALALGLTQTHFVNVTGLDPTDNGDKINLSTANNLLTLMRHIEKSNPDILSLTTKKQFSLSDADGNYITTLSSTNKLLDRTDVPFLILGGKTGTTPRARQNLIIVTEAPCGGKLFSVVLGSENSFDDMQKLLLHISNSYEWTCK